VEHEPPLQKKKVSKKEAKKNKKKLFKKKDKEIGKEVLEVENKDQANQKVQKKHEDGSKKDEVGRRPLIRAPQKPPARPNPQAQESKKKKI